MGTTAHPWPALLAQGGIGITTSGLQQWLTTNGVGVVVVLIGISLLIYALRGEANRVLTVVGLSVVGLAMLSLATVNGAPAAVGSFFLSLLNIHGGR